MEIVFESYRLEALCSNEKGLRRKYGAEGAKKIMARISALEEAETLAEMRRLPGRCHELTGDRSGELAIVLYKGYRLIIRPVAGRQSKRDGGLDWASVSAIVVIGIVDYH